MALPDPPLLIITDRHQADRPLEEIAEAAFEAGARWLSVREKDLPWADVLSLVERIGANAPDDAVIGVHGVPEAATDAIRSCHLPRDGDVAALRHQWPDLALIGKSCHDLASVQAAQRDGADYVTISPIFETRSKPGYGPGIGLLGLRSIARLTWETRTAAVALGGIGPANIGDCRAAGAAGVAVMGDVMRAGDSGAVVRSLVATWTAAEPAVPFV